MDRVNGSYLRPDDSQLAPEARVGWMIQFSNPEIFRLNISLFYPSLPVRTVQVGCRAPCTEPRGPEDRGNRVNHSEEAVQEMEGSLPRFAIPLGNSRISRIVSCSFSACEVDVGALNAGEGATSETENELELGALAADLPADLEVDALNF